jgi:hypothetical protein
MLSNIRVLNFKQTSRGQETQKEVNSLVRGKVRQLSVGKLAILDIAGSSETINEMFILTILVLKFI